jgi:hypothetical protein
VSLTAGRFQEVSPVSRKKPAKKTAPRRGLTLDDVREIALSMPEVTETTAYGMPAFKAGGKRFAGQPVARPDVHPNSLGVHASFEERDRLIAARPDVYYLTEHYAAYPAVLARLSNMRRSELRELLAAAWRTAMEGTRAKRKTRSVADLPRVGRR